MLPRIPVRIVATLPDEAQAVVDVLNAGVAGALVVAGDGEKALVALVCPSGNRDDAAGVPAVVLGAAAATSDTDTDAAPVRFIKTPARLNDVLTQLESLAQDAAMLGRRRDYHGWVLDGARAQLDMPDGRVAGLTDTENRLLAALFDAEGEDVDRATLLARVWGYRAGLDTHTLETHIYRLRQKIETNPTSPSFLMTTENGYRLA